MTTLNLSPPCDARGLADWLTTDRRTANKLAKCFESSPDFEGIYGAIASALSSPSTAYNREREDARRRLHLAIQDLLPLASRVSPEAWRHLKRAGELAEPVLPRRKRGHPGYDRAWLESELREVGIVSKAELRLILRSVGEHARLAPKDLLLKLERFAERR
jgi:hypothetical protein